MNWIKLLGARLRPKPLHEWFRVTFDADVVSVSAEPFLRRAWSQEFRWASIERIAFVAEPLEVSDGIYVFTSERPESYVIPTEADGGGIFWEEILRRGLFDPELAIEAAASPQGTFIWPPLPK